MRTVNGETVQQVVMADLDLHEMGAPGQLETWQTELNRSEQLSGTIKSIVFKIGPS